MNSVSWGVGWQPGHGDSTCVLVCFFSPSPIFQELLNIRSSFNFALTCWSGLDTHLHLYAHSPRASSRFDARPQLWHPYLRLVVGGIGCVDFVTICDRVGCEKGCALFVFFPGEGDQDRYMGNTRDSRAITLIFLSDSISMISQSCFVIADWYRNH